MLDSLKGLFKKEFQFSHIAHILQQLNGLAGVFNAQFLKDETSKNEAIDLICNILQGHKDSPACEQAKEGCNAAN